MGIFVIRWIAGTLLRISRQSRKRYWFYDWRERPYTYARPVAIWNGSKTNHLHVKVTTTFYAFWYVVYLTNLQCLGKRQPIKHLSRTSGTHMYLIGANDIFVHDMFNVYHSTCRGPINYAKHFFQYAPKRTTLITTYHGRRLRRGGGGGRRDCSPQCLRRLTLCL